MACRVGCCIHLLAYARLGPTGVTVPVQHVLRAVRVGRVWAYWALNIDLTSFSVFLPLLLTP